MPRPKLKKSEKKHIIQVFVKSKHHAAAKKEIAAIARKYNSKEDNSTPAKGGLDGG